MISCLRGPLSAFIDQYLEVWTLTRRLSTRMFLERLHERETLFPRHGNPKTFHWKQTFAYAQFRKYIQWDPESSTVLNNVSLAQKLAKCGNKCLSKKNVSATYVFCARKRGNMWGNNASFAEYVTCVRETLCTRWFNNLGLYAFNFMSPYSPLFNVTHSVLRSN